MLLEASIIALEHLTSKCSPSRIEVDYNPVIDVIRGLLADKVRNKSRWLHRMCVEVESNWRGEYTISIVWNRRVSGGKVARVFANRPSSRSQELNTTKIWLTSSFDEQLCPCSGFLTL